MLSHVMVEVLGLLGRVLGAYLALMVLVAVVIVLASWWHHRAAHEPPRRTRRDLAAAAGTADADAAPGFTPVVTGRAHDNNIGSVR